MPIPDGLDEEKLAEVALAILCLSAESDGIGARAWKGMDWDVTNLLYEKGWISNPRGKAKSVAVTEEGMKLAEIFQKKHFGIED